MRGVQFPICDKRHIYCTTHHTRARVGEANLALGRYEESTRAFKVALKLEPGNNPILMRSRGWSSTKKLQTKKLQLTKKLQPPGERFQIHPALTSRRPPRLLLRLVLLLLLRRAQLCRHPTRHPPRGRHPPRHPPWAPRRTLFASRLARSTPRTSKQSPRRMPSAPRRRRSAHAWRLSKRGAC